MKRRDLTGVTFGRWTVLGFSHAVKKNAQWFCQCSCGTKRIVPYAVLSTGKSKSCGCLRDELASKRATTHGMTGTPLHRVWKAIHNRCNNKKNKWYGAKGITVCARWSSFESFRDDMGSSWSDGMSIERKNNKLGYSPSNCIWIPKKDQSKNTSWNKLIKTPWGILTLSDTARKLGIHLSAMWRRTQQWPESRWLETAYPTGPRRQKSKRRRR